MRREIPGEFIIVGAGGARTGRFVASTAAEAQGMLARRHGYASVAEAEAAKPGWRKEHRVLPAVERDEPRRATTNINAILDTVLLTEEEQGTTGHLVRRSLYEMAGRITGDDILTWLAAHTNDSDDADELRYWMQAIVSLVDSMRIDALGQALRDVGLATLAHNVEMSGLVGRDVGRRGLPENLARVEAVLKQRWTATTDAGERSFLKVAMKAHRAVLRDGEVRG